MFIEGVGRCGLGGEIYHLVPAGPVGAATLGMLTGEDAGLLAAEGAGAGGGFQEVGEGHEVSSAFLCFLDLIAGHSASVIGNILGRIFLSDFLDSLCPVVSRTVRED